VKFNPYIICPIIACLSLMACKKEGPAGKNSLIDQIPEPAGVHCISGGFKIITGIDDNRNNVLDSNEIQKTEYVCNDIDIYNKETTLYFASSAFGTTSATPIVPTGYIINDFNISNYPADSILFGGYLRSDDGISKCYLELYDVTNNTVINNTTLTSTSQISEYKSTTVNFLNQLPKSPIKLGFRFRSEKSGSSVVVNNPAIKIYKK
jgi:hypothetical protein